MDIVFSKGALDVSKNLGNEVYYGKELVILKNPNRSDLGKNVDIVYGYEENSRKDFIHHRNSGINQIIAKILFEKKIAFGFSFAAVLKNSMVIGRMKQNVILCRKYNVEMILASFALKKNDVRTLEDLKVFGKIIGMTGAEVKKSFSILSKKIEYMRKKQAGKIPYEGVEIL